MKAPVLFAGLFPAAASAADVPCAGFPTDVAVLLVVLIGVAAMAVLFSFADLISAKASEANERARAMRGNAKANHPH